MNEFEMSSQSAYAPQQVVTIKPDAAEKKLIKRQYVKVGLVILFNVFMFNIVLLGIIYGIIALLQGDFSSIDAILNGINEFSIDNPSMMTVFSCSVPIVSEVLAILLGVKLLKLDLKKLFTREGYTGSTVVKLSAMSIGFQTLAAILFMIISTIFSYFGLESATSDFSVDNNSIWATLFMYFYACLLGPVLEELLYRGVVLQGLRKYNERFAIIISALIFGLMHQNYQQFILGFLIGIPLAAVTLKYESIIPAIITHIVVNTSGMLLSLYMQNSDYAAFQEVAAGGMDFSNWSGGFVISIILNAIFRYGFLIASGIIAIIALVKKGNFKKPTLAGKSRGWPVLATSVTWYVIGAVYLFLNFVYAFMI